ncbi:molybdate ABC transporter substrate-binding protein [Acuticoccus mangrovi]|uniref:Molybdate ABC transporter substrate-binding protein n=1 Tax=Acuticoccus mangrovi TaxID=2796142 RepID=A0A934IQ70_9HYPH|nr:molybdate ABC transporter substrate-binding protein [Acuticoccus mangrovi]MBJ3776690.1 molybdate ABC transporter substrate-binding protein [Acuticoccus mangrovi]
MRHLIASTAADLAAPRRAFARGAARRIAATGLAALMALAVPAAASADEVVVFAAASLKNALEDVADAWHEETGGTATISFAGSSALARQIQAGAPADVFISANVGWMDTLEEDDLIIADTRRDVLANSIVLIAADPDAAPVTLEPGVDIAGLLDGGRLAMALVDAVPAGIYGKAALTSLGVWDDVAPQVAQADNVRAALALVARGEAPYGIVYATDAAAEPAVKVVATFPADTHPPIIYPAALTTGTDDPDAADFLDFMSSPAAAPLFERQGFKVIE